MRVPVAMTIAGSDSGGGAGIQADLKTFAALGVHGTTAITSITAQNTFSVKATFDLSPSMVVEQIIAVHEDLGIDAAKTGMLSNSNIIEVVAKTIEELGVPLVVDPVMISKSGAPLLRPEAVDTLKKKLLRVALLVTPNIPEAESLAGFSINSIDEMKEAAVTIHEKYGSEAVIVKGGHLKSDKVIDVLYYRGELRIFEHRRIRTQNNHGSGCAFSAAITAHLARGLSLVESVEKSLEFIDKALYYSLPIGRGHGPVNPIAVLEEAAERWRVLVNLSEAIEILLENQEKISKLVPEVGLNIGMSLPWLYARTINDVAAVPGRISRYKNGIIIPAKPEFGVSRHIATFILTIMEHDPTYRAAANIAYSNEKVEKILGLGLSLSSFDRREEPPEVKRTEGMTTVWGVRTAIAKNNSRVPDAIIDYGEHGKEPLIFIVGNDAVDVANKLVKIASS